MVRAITFWLKPFLKAARIVLIYVGVIPFVFECASVVDFWHNLLTRQTIDEEAAAGILFFFFLSTVAFCINKTVGRVLDPPLPKVPPIVEKFMNILCFGLFAWGICGMVQTEGSILYFLHAPFQEAADKLTSSFDTLVFSALSMALLGGLHIGCIFVINRQIDLIVKIGNILWWMSVLLMGIFSFVGLSNRGERVFVGLVAMIIVWGVALFYIYHSKHKKRKGKK